MFIVFLDVSIFAAFVLICSCGDFYAFYIFHVSRIVHNFSSMFHVLLVYVLHFLFLLFLLRSNFNSREFNSCELCRFFVITGHHGGFRLSLEEIFLQASWEIFLRFWEVVEVTDLHDLQHRRKTNH